MREAEAPTPAAVPFWHRLVSILSLFHLTTLNRGLTYVSHAIPTMRTQIASRFPTCRLDVEDPAELRGWQRDRFFTVPAFPFQGRDTLSEVLRTVRYLTARPRRVLVVEHQVTSDCVRVTIS